MYEEPSGEKPIRRRAATSAGCTVVLGGGTGGLVAARELRRRLPTSHRVVLVDRSADHTYQPSLLWQMVGQRRPDQFRRPLNRLERKGIEFRNAEVEELDLDNKLVRTGSGDLDYDSLVVSLGAQLAPETVDGFEQMAYNLYDPHGCAQIHSALEDFSEGTIGILITAMPFKCPAAPYEAAFLTESFIRQEGDPSQRGDSPLHARAHADAGRATRVGDSIADMLSARGIHYHPLFTFKELRPETREVVSSDGRVRPGRPVDRDPSPSGAGGRAIVSSPRRLGFHPRRSADAAYRTRRRVRDRRRDDDQAAQRQGATQGGRVRALARRRS